VVSGLYNKQLMMNLNQIIMDYIVPWLVLPHVKDGGLIYWCAMSTMLFITTGMVSSWLIVSSGQLLYWLFCRELIFVADG